ncbi:kinase-like domain-containing protein [Mycena alexandri]|uniref:Kinase-like domain-containing protein n=1 Tax=Mycena alexandri TaxID=1745969 RepID=A0AAD6S472_9AGAR|nr:kinase-like domain-containing protein [Mycena alexandri]
MSVPYGLEAEQWNQLRERSKRLLPSERWWVNQQPFLLSRGYALRPRYHPDWIPTWELPGNEEIWPPRFEDSLSTVGRGNVLDATRIADNVKVVLKIVRKWSDELTLTRHFGQKIRDDNPHNRCVTLLDVIYLSEPEQDIIGIIVLPFLREFDDPPFEQIGEVREALDQFLQGMEYLHINRVAHRDLCHGNLMMDGSRVIPKGWHFTAPYTHTGTVVGIDSEPRHTVFPVEYFIIDFGLSSMFPAHMSIDDAREIGRYGQDKTVPELSDTVSYNPFKVDIYQLGNVIMKLIETYEGLEIFRELAELMTSQNPNQRPTASECVKFFRNLVLTMVDTTPVYHLSSSDSESDDGPLDSVSNEAPQSASEHDSGGSDLEERDSSLQERESSV